jgi:hypothetical protein
MSAKSKPVPAPVGRDPDLDKDIHELIREVVPAFFPDLDLNAWMTTPNPRLGDISPADVIDTPREPLLRNLLRAARHGMFS